VRIPGQPETSKCRLLDLLPATLAILAITALAVDGLMFLAALSVHPGPHHLAFLRSLAICAVALALAFSGSQWRRKELTRIVYAALTLVAVKLVFEDLRHGHPGFIAASIFVVAVTWIAVPRIARLRQRI
jgi:hypothetical protein